MKISLIFITALAFLGISFSSCKKTNDSNANKTNGNNYSDPMLSESSGWKRVAKIRYSGNFVDQLKQNSMTGYDLTMLNGNLQMLYSEDKIEGNGTFSFYLKVSTAPNSSSDPIIYTIPAGMPSYPINQPSFVPVFRPGTFNMETFAIWQNTGEVGFHLDHYDESAKQISTQYTQFNASHSIKMLSNGDVLIGEVNSSINGELAYYNRIIGKWTYISQGAGDLQWLIAYTPFKLDDGSLLAFRCFSKKGKAFLSIADFVPSAVYPAAPYNDRFVEEHAEYAPNGFAANGIQPTYASTASIAAYTTAGNSVVVVLKNQDKTTNAYTLSAYKWTKGDASFTKLYSGISISTELGDALTHRDQVGCTIDGTAYALLHINSKWSLVLANGAGEKTYGSASDNNGGRFIARMNCLRYFDGAFYALVTPYFFGADYEGQHMDVVKLTP